MLITNTVSSPKHRHTAKAFRKALVKALLTFWQTDDWVEKNRALWRAQELEKQLTASQIKDCKKKVERIRKITEVAQ